MAKALGVELTELFRADELFKEVNSKNRTLMEKISMVDALGKEIADALEVSLDFLAGNSKQAALDKQTLRLIHDIEELEPAVKDKLFFLANAIIFVKCSLISAKPSPSSSFQFPFSLTINSSLHFTF